MKKLILIISVLFIIVFGYFFIQNLQLESDTNQVIISVLNGILVLMGILVAIVIIPKLNRRKTKKIIYNSYSKKRNKSENFNNVHNWLKN
ncbi:MAG: membrane protein YdbS with pleckstrin-like domain [Flavobacterium sp.]|jgi:membrane protein YdbS with pleckstrin-like domain